MKYRALLAAGILFGTTAFTLSAQAPLPTAPTSGAFAPFHTWQAAVRQGDMDALKTMYADQPALAILLPGGGTTRANYEATYWSQWKRAGLTDLEIEVMNDTAVDPRLHLVEFEAGIHIHSARGDAAYYSFVQQVWYEQSGTWRIVSTGQTALDRLKQPTPSAMGAQLYSKSADAHADIAAALARAKTEHKRVLLDFGGNWCYDCHVLSIAFENSAFAPILQANYIVVNVDVEEFNYNVDVAKQYDVPLEKGVPALAVLDSDGKVLMSQKNGEFEAAHSLGPDDIIKFLNAWKPTQ